MGNGISLNCSSERLKSPLDMLTWVKIPRNKQKALDKAFCIIRINPKSCFMQHPCDHHRTEIIARRDGVEYLECLDCRQIFEAEDLEPVTVEEEDE